MAETMVKNMQQVEELLKNALVRVNDVSVRHYQSAVWALFQELVLTTPQFSGRAAANWNIGLDAPDFSVDHELGEQMEVVDNKTKEGAHPSISPKRVGDRKWAEEAFARNRYKIRKIGVHTKVFISNAVHGEADTDPRHPTNSPYYLADLQSADYWYKKLREVNQPYETVADVLMSEAWRNRMKLHGDGNNQAFFA